MANKPVVITTEARGVFFGYLPDGQTKLPAEVELENVRMCVYWSTDVKGVLGLASNGPTKDCRITNRVPKVTLYKVTAVLDCSPQAQESWEKDIWRS